MGSVALTVGLALLFTAGSAACAGKHPDTSTTGDPDGTVTFRAVLIDLGEGHINGASSELWEYLYPTDEAHCHCGDDARGIAVSYLADLPADALHCLDELRCDAPEWGLRFYGRQVGPIPTPWLVSHKICAGGSREQAAFEEGVRDTLSWAEAHPCCEP